MDIATTNKLFEMAFGIKSYEIYSGKTSYLGTPILFPIKFVGKKYLVYNRFGELELKSFESFDLPVSTLTQFRRAKVIRRTKTVAGKGTVKELYGFDDWSIDIRGLCIADPGHLTAKTEMEQHINLLKWEEIVDSIQISGELFTAKNINNLVIEDIQFQQLKGVPGVMPFTIRAKSDEPIELVL